MGRWRIGMLLVALLAGCGSGEPIQLDPIAVEDDDTGDDDTGDDDTGDDDTGDDDTASSCPWDGDYTGTTYFYFFFDTFEGPTSAEVTDCQIDGEILFDFDPYPVWVHMSGFIGQGGGAIGNLNGDFGPLGTIDEEWTGAADEIGLTGQFYLFEGKVGDGEFDIVRQ